MNLDHGNLRGPVRRSEKSEPEMKIQQWANKWKLAESWDEACKRSIKSRVEKGTVMIVHVLSGWLASSYPIRRALFQHSSWRVSVESAINKRKSSCHSAWRNGSIATWMFVHPTNTAVILDLKCCLINQKLFLSISEYHYYYQGRKWSMPDFWNRHNHSLSRVYRFIWSCRVFFYWLVFPT